jgi:hypothetical protein
MTDPAANERVLFERQMRLRTIKRLALLAVFLFAVAEILLGSASLWALACICLAVALSASAIYGATTVLIRLGNVGVFLERRKNDGPEGPLNGSQ